MTGSLPPRDPRIDLWKQHSDDLQVRLQKAEARVVKLEKAGDKLAAEVDRYRARTFCVPGEALKKALAGWREVRGG